MTEYFQKKLDDIISQCFTWKRCRKKSNEKPWITDHVRKLVKKRKAIFRKEGRSKRWKGLTKPSKPP